MKILITGCGRSGTQFLSKILKYHDLDFLHEDIRGKDGTISWFLMFDRQDIPYWNITKKNYVNFKPNYHNRFNKKILLVRHPLDVITSVYNTFENISLEYIIKCISEINNQDSKLLCVMKYYLYWNLEGLKTCDFYIKIENIEFDINKILNLYDITKKNISHFSKKTHTRNIKEVESKNSTGIKKVYNKITWEDLENEDIYIANQIRGLCENLKYNI